METEVPRKHRKQMTTAEIAAVETAIKSVAWWHPTRHVVERMQERHGNHLATSKRMIEALAGGEVIEARPDGRAVIRAGGDCLVVHVPTKAVIGYWWNAPDDQHDTLNLAAYRWQGNVTEVFANVR